MRSLQQISRGAIAALALAAPALAQSAEDSSSYSFGEERKYLGIVSEAGASAKSAAKQDKVTMHMYSDARAFSQRTRLFDYYAKAVAGNPGTGEPMELVRLQIGSLTLVNQYSDPNSEWNQWFDPSINGVHTYSIFEANRSINVLNYGITLQASVTAACSLAQSPEAWNSEANRPEDASGARGARLGGSMTGSAHGMVAAGVRVMLVRVKAVGEFELMNATMRGYERNELLHGRYVTQKGGLTAQNREIVGGATVRARGISALLKIVVQIRGLFKWRTLFEIDIMKHTASSVSHKLLDHDAPIDPSAYADYWNQFLPE